MSYRSATFASALVASILAGANFTAVAQDTSKPAETCQASPKGTAPAGSHWYYHSDRATKTKCWYLGDAKTKTTKSAAAQPKAQPAAEAADASPAPSQPLQQAQQPAPPQPAMRKSVADARAELIAAQANVAPAAAQDAGATNSAASPSSPSTDTPQPSSAVTSRWLDASSMAGTNGTRLAAAQPLAAAQADTAPALASPATPATSAPTTSPEAAPADKSSASTQMLLIVMVGALMLAGIVSALVFKLTRTRTPPYEIRDEWRAPWDSIHTEQSAPAAPRHERPMRLSEERPEERPARPAELAPRRAEPPMPRRDARERDEAGDATQQITAMLERLARSAAT